MASAASSLVVEGPFPHHPVDREAKLFNDLINAQRRDRAVAAAAVGEQPVGIGDGGFATLDGDVHVTGLQRKCGCCAGRPINPSSATRRRSMPRETARGSPPIGRQSRPASPGGNDGLLLDAGPRRRSAGPPNSAAQRGRWWSSGPDIRRCPARNRQAAATASRGHQREVASCGWCTSGAAVWKRSQSATAPPSARRGRARPASRGRKG